MKKHLRSNDLDEEKKKNKKKKTMTTAEEEEEEEGENDDETDEFMGSPDVTATTAIGYIGQ
jgi:hypothetical protein